MDPLTVGGRHDGRSGEKHVRRFGAAQLGGCRR